MPSIEIPECTLAALAGVSGGTFIAFIKLCGLFPHRSVEEMAAVAESYHRRNWHKTDGQSIDEYLNLKLGDIDRRSYDGTLTLDYDGKRTCNSKLLRDVLGTDTSTSAGNWWRRCVEKQEERGYY